MIPKMNTWKNERHLVSLSFHNEFWKKTELQIFYILKRMEKSLVNENKSLYMNFLWSDLENFNIGLQAIIQKLSKKISFSLYH